MAMKGQIKSLVKLEGGEGLAGGARGIQIIFVIIEGGRSTVYSLPYTIY